MSISTTVNTVSIVIEDDLLHEMICFGEEGYPEEVVGFILGAVQADKITLRRFLKAENSFEGQARYQSYRISSYDWLRSESEAKRLAMDVVGVFHTHPDHPSIPSAYDLEFALPNIVYLIAAIHEGRLASVQAWKLQEDRNQFDECLIQKVSS